MVIIQLNSGRFFVGKCATFLLMYYCLFLFSRKGAKMRKFFTHVL